jgi:hypothetical protein
MSFFFVSLLLSKKSLNFLYASNFGVFALGVLNKSIVGFLPLLEGVPKPRQDVYDFPRSSPFDEVWGLKGLKGLINPFLPGESNNRRLVIF